jgi:predicted nucleotidyltransferase
MKETISTHLTTIERKYAVTILYACESGSRAWGFASTNSDYDVRFVYVHARDWYLSIHEKRNVIEYMDDGVLDINGWDIRKALRLLQKGNAALREWLHSPVIYLARDPAHSMLLELAQQAFLPETLCHHYLAMARKSLAGIKDAPQAKLKSYLYALRPLLCCKWIVERNTQPPMLIDELLSACFPQEQRQVWEHVQQLLEQKRHGKETSSGERSEMFESFLAEQSTRLETGIPKNPAKCPANEFDRVFKALLTMDNQQ